MLPLGTDVPKIRNYFKVVRATAWVPYFFFPCEMLHDCVGLLFLLLAHQKAAVFSHTTRL